MSAREAVRDYYEAVGRGEPLGPCFVEGRRERLRTTEDWRIETTVAQRDDRPFGGRNVSAPHPR